MTSLRFAENFLQNFVVQPARWFSPRGRSAQFTQRRVPADLLYSDIDIDAFDFKLPAPPFQKPEAMSDVSVKTTVTQSTTAFRFRRGSALHPEVIAIDGAGSMSVAPKRANASADAGPEPKRIPVEQLRTQDAKEPIDRLDIATVVARQQEALSRLV